MKKSRSVESITIKIVAILYSPFLFILLLLFAITSFLSCLVYTIITKFYKDVQLPRIFNILLDDFSYSYFNHQTEYNKSEFANCF